MDGKYVSIRLLTDLVAVEEVLEVLEVVSAVTVAVEEVVEEVDMEPQEAVEAVAPRMDLDTVKVCCPITRF